MKSKHRNAAKAKRRWARDPLAHMRVFNKLAPFTQDELVKLATPVRLAFERIKVGTAHDDDFDTLAAAINVAMVRAEAIDPLVEQTCQAAADALMRTKDRHTRTGRWGFDGLALQDIPPAIDLHEQMLELSTPLQMQQAMVETLQRMEVGHVREVA